MRHHDANSCPTDSAEFLRPAEQQPNEEDRRLQKYHVIAYFPGYIKDTDERL